MCSADPDHRWRPLVAVLTPSPGPRRLVKAPSRATLSPKGARAALVCDALHFEYHG